MGDVGGVTGRPSKDMITELPPMWWADFGRCRGMYDELSFWVPTADENHKKAEQPHERRQREAECKKVCAACEVRIECLQWAIDHAELGVWGGTTDDERHLLTAARFVDLPRIG